MRQTVILIVLDGLGIGEQGESNPVSVVRPPTLLRLEKEYPVTSLDASGIAVGLPWGEAGSSEVGHVTLGAGKVLYQNFPRISLAIGDKSFFKNPALVEAFEHAKKNGSAMNLVGLLSRNNTNASLEHLKALLQMAHEQYAGVPIKLHLFTDPSEKVPHSLEVLLKEVPMENVASLSGRYYSMNHERNWNLIKNAYDVIAHDGPAEKDFSVRLKLFYGRNLNEDQLPPMRLQEHGAVKDGDAVIFFNFEESGMRQVCEAFIAPDFDKFPAEHFPKTFFCTMTQYEERFAPHVRVAFAPESVEVPLGKVLGDAGRSQLRLCESQKYALVTYYFNGFHEAAYPGEFRVAIPSLQAVKVQDVPELVGGAISDRLIPSIEEKGFDFILVNYCNADVMAHAGSFEAAKAAVHFLDGEIAKICEAASHTDAIVCITADHGNVERMFDPLTGHVQAQHSTNPVPFYIVGAQYKGRRFLNQENLRGQTAGTLADVAPTILQMLGMPKPPSMTGRSLLEDLF